MFIQSFFQEIFPKCWLFILQCQFICHGVIFVLILQLSSQNIKISPQPESKFSAPDIGSFSPPTGTCMWHINKSILIFNYINLYFVIMLHDLVKYLQFRYSLDAFLMKCFFVPVKFSVGTPPNVSTPWRRGSIGSSQGGAIYHPPSNASNSPSRRASKFL